MLSIYVKHFLNDAGIGYFHNEWFQWVMEAVSIIDLQQARPGFISLDFERDVEDPTCINILLCFEDESTLDVWCNTPEHEELVVALDPYRTRSWLYASVEREAGAKIMPSELEWIEVIPEEN